MARSTAVVDPRKRVTRSVLALGLVAVLALLGLDLASHDRSGGREAPPAAEGYTRLGEIDGTVYWGKLFAANDFGLRTTGRLGGICNSRGPYAAAEPTDLCGSSVEGVGTVAAFVEPATVRGMTVTLTDGTDAHPAGILAIGSVLPGQRLWVFFSSAADVGVEEALTS